VEIGGVGSPVGTMNYASCGLKADDTLWCWGHNWWGNLGDGTDVDHEIPAPVLVSAGGAPFDDVRTFEVDYWSVGCAVKNSGSVWCWGRNYEGQLGDDFNALGDRDRREDRPRPVRAHRRRTSLVLGLPDRSAPTAPARLLPLITRGRRASH
jgi:alpha-tubulin suppressor-like RCC1 family protein